MSDVNITELRQHLPAYLAKVRKGERVRVTLRGKVVAEITPPAAMPEEAAAARMRLRGSLVRYDKPFEPVISPDEWEMNR